jgi:two-component system chemotaxis response regulator CheB
MAMRILLVEDDEGLSELLEVTFALDERFKLVGRARNGLEGVELFDRLHPDAVLMDLHMPMLGGVQATRQILQRDPHACVIAFTASRDPGEHDAARRAGAAAVLEKPFDPVRFLDAFEAHARTCASEDADAA